MVLMKNVITSLAKSVLMPLRSTAATWAADEGTHKKMLGSSMTTLIILNREMDDVMKIVKSLEESGLLIEGVIKSVKNKGKEQKCGFLRMLLGTLEAS